MGMIMSNRRPIPKPLTKTTKDGTVYERRPAVTEEIVTLLEQGSAGILAEIQKGKSFTRGLKPETLVYFIRNSSRMPPDLDVKEAMYEAFWDHCVRLLRSWFGSSLKDEIDEFCQDIGAYFIERFIDPNDNRVDYVEVSFFQFLKKLAKTEFKKKLREKELSKKSQSLSGEDGKPIEVRDWAAACPYNQLQLERVLISLSPEERKLLNLILEGLPTQKIAERLDQTARNINYRKKQLHQKLANQLGGSS